MDTLPLSSRPVKIDNRVHERWYRVPARLDLDLKAVTFRRLFRDRANGGNGGVIEGLSQSAWLDHLNHVGDSGRAGRSE